jgi:L-rhamnose mutarotase
MPKATYQGGAMVRIGQVWRAKPGKTEEYRRFHATVPPAVERALRDAGVTTYAVYGWGDTFFSYMEVADYEKMVERYNGDVDAQLFEQEAAEFIEFIETDPETGWPRALDEVWVLSNPDVGITDE